MEKAAVDLFENACALGASEPREGDTSGKRWVKSLTTTQVRALVGYAVRDVHENYSLLAWLDQAEDEEQTSDLLTALADARSGLDGCKFLLEQVGTVGDLAFELEELDRRVLQSIDGLAFPVPRKTPTAETWWGQWETVF
jgi:hypothetical protein